MICRRLAVFAVLAAVLVTSAPRSNAQGGPPGPPPDVQRAQAALAAGRADSAVLILEQFFARTPNAAAGRLLLGNALRQLGQLERALAAYDAVTTPSTARLQADLNAARVLAALGRRTDAIQRLGRVKRSGAFDMDLVRSDTALASLASVAGYSDLFWRAEEFAQPFVEPVRIIHEWRGEAKGDQYSWIARGIGDVDGDRVTDIVTSAPSFDTPAPVPGAAPVPGRGKIYVYSGRSGRLLWTALGPDRAALGNGLEGAGDVDRDGVPDVIASAPGVERAFVYSGRDGRVIHTLAPPVTGGRFGGSASGAGDQNGDGYADLIVGAAFGSGATPATAAAGTAPPMPGRAYVFSGLDGSLLTTLVGTQPGDGFGSIVSGDRGGTRSPLLVGAPGAGTPGIGRVFVFDAGATTPRVEIAPDSSGAALGAMFISVVGDVDRDGVRDFFSSDFADASRGPSTGRIYVNSGRDGRRLRTISGEAAGDGFGIGAPDLGDVNGDGFPDLVLGAWQHASAAPSGGKIYVYSGKDGALLRSFTGRVPGETLGFDATGVGDVDGDGVTDLLVTSSWSNVNGFRSGRMYVISGR